MRLPPAKGLYEGVGGWPSRNRAASGTAPAAAAMVSAEGSPFRPKGECVHESTTPKNRYDAAFRPAPSMLLAPLLCAKTYRPELHVVLSPQAPAATTKPKYCARPFSHEIAICMRAPMPKICKCAARENRHILDWAIA